MRAVDHLAGRTMTAYLTMYLGVIASEAKQSMLPRRRYGLLRRFAPRNDADRPHLIGGAYWMPPLLHSEFSPRGIFSFDPSPTLRS